MQAVTRIQHYTTDMTFEDFANMEEIVVQGILYNFIIIGEAASNVPADIQSRYPEIPWRMMSGMRNVMAHEYFQVEMDRVWEAVQDDLPSLIPQLQQLLEKET